MENTIDRKKRNIINNLIVKGISPNNKRNNYDMKAEIVNFIKEAVRININIENVNIIKENVSKVTFGKFEDKIKI